ncbi:hypothetical protein MHU86_6567 [Fragilaria crotonensis]|nr:hypothetical protein MHU86_6567 [Fragilaria crotonensis]
MTPDELMLAAKNKYDSMVEKGTWNAPTAEEKIVALEAKLETTVKNLNKKYRLNWERRLVERRPATSPRTRRDTTSRKVIPRHGLSPSKAIRRKSNTKASPGTGAEKTQAASVRSGGHTSPMNAREGRKLHPAANAKRPTPQTIRAIRKRARQEVEDRQSVRCKD